MVGLGTSTRWTTILSGTRSGGRVTGAGRETIVARTGNLKLGGKVGIRKGGRVGIRKGGSVGSDGRRKGGRVGSCW